MDKIKCEFCGKYYASNRIKVHLEKKHNKSVKDNTLKFLNIKESDLPKCMFCDNKVTVSYKLNKICNSKNCKEKLIHFNKSQALIKRTLEGNNPLSKENRPKDENGKDVYSKNAVNIQLMNNKHPFQKENRIYDENGKDILASNNAKLAVSNGTSNFLKENRKFDENGNDIISKKAHKTIKKNLSNPLLSKNRKLDKDGNDIIAGKIATNRSINGTCALSSNNRPKDEFGNDIYAKKQIESRKRNGFYKHIRNYDDLNPSYLMNFVKNNKFDLLAMMKYFNISHTTANFYKRKFNIYIPNKCLNKRKLQSDVYKYIERLLKENGISTKVYQDYRKLISPKELDIYLPDYNLAIEFDGVYWHTNIDSNYHRIKTDECQKKNVKLFHIFENEWIDENKRNLWKSMIKNSLGLSEVIYARNCKLVRNPKGIKNFLKENHMQGFIPSEFNYGLYFNNELISVMTFSKSRFDKDFDFELIRFCNKRNTRVIGAASKLLKYFKVDHKGTIVSYANKRWSDGNLYKSLGFKYIKDLPPDYFYFSPEWKILNRISCQKHKLSKLLGDKFDSNKTEKENMINAGYRIIYDSGNKKYGLNYE